MTRELLRISRGDAGHGYEQVRPSNSPQAIGGANNQKQEVETDSLGFDQDGRRNYKGFIILRLDGKFSVDGELFSTLGKAKRYISDRAG